MKIALLYAGLGIGVALIAAVGLYMLTFATYIRDVAKRVRARLTLDK